MREKNSARQADGSMRAEPTFDPRHVADAVVQMAQLPLGVSVPSMTPAATSGRSCSPTLCRS